MAGFMVSAVAVLSVGCSKTGLTTGQRTCGYAGKTYNSGTTFPSTDGCNTCSCESSGAVACTLMACLGDASPSAADDAMAVPPTPDGRAGSDIARSSDDAKPDGNPFADAMPILDGTSEYKPPADAANDPKPGMDVKPAPDTDDSAQDTGLTCILPDGGPGQRDCYVCTCMENGQVFCALVSCPPVDAGKDPCALPTAVTFGAIGGMVTYQDQFKLDVSGGLALTRNYLRGAIDGATARTCMPTLPACGASPIASVSTIIADLAAPDVQAAFALSTPPIYGVDERPTDGTIWSITLASGGSVLVGTPCASQTMNSCRPIPAGVQKLADDLKSLSAGAAAQSVCAGL
jgi:hypothetical protein